MASIAINAIPWSVDMPSGFIKSYKVQGRIPMDDGGGAALTYRMRGYDETLLTIVYWDADHVDADASDYTGPGPITASSIVVQWEVASA